MFVYANFKFKRFCLFYRSAVVPLHMLGHNFDYFLKFSTLTYGENRLNWCHDIDLLMDMSGCICKSTTSSYFFNGSGSDPNTKSRSGLWVKGKRWFFLRFRWFKKRSKIFWFLKIALNRLKKRIKNISSLYHSDLED